ncbi:MAG: sulfatase [Dysgonamonadaceae bacterium]|nr:sulfatase [Dysgonamonadaceae bacterium]
MNRNLIKSMTLIALGKSLVSCAPKEQEVKQPNIIFIMSDDHAYQAISAYGHGLNQTPNIDRIANEGAIFSRATVTNSISAPSRAVLLTGKHSFVNGKVDNVQPFNWDQDNFPKLLQANGYETAMIGKIHMDGKPQGFDYSMVLPGQGKYYNPDFIKNGEKPEVIEGYVTEIITDLALDWMKNKRNPNKPFCLLYHHKAPHREWLPAEKYYKEYTKMTFPKPETLYDDYEGRGTAAKTAEMNIAKEMTWIGDIKIYPETAEEFGIDTPWGRRLFDLNIGRMNEEQRAAWDSVYRPIDEEFKKLFPTMSEKDIMDYRYQRYMQDYLATIASVDDGVGQVLDFLDEAGLAENTIVIYTSDQGFYLGEHGWFDKRFMYEESFRMPLLMRYPKEIKAGTKIDDLVQNLDFAPTFLDYTNTETPQEIQGESFRDLVAGKIDKWRDAVYYTYYEYPSVHMVKRHYGVATKRYKLMHFYYDIDEWEMYDLETDPMEMRNIYDDESYADVRKDLHKRLDELRTYYGDSDENDQKYLNEYLEALKPKKEN